MWGPNTVVLWYDSSTYTQPKHTFRDVDRYRQTVKRCYSFLLSNHVTMKLTWLCNLLRSILTWTCVLYLQLPQRYRKTYKYMECSNIPGVPCTHWPRISPASNNEHAMRDNGILLNAATAHALRIISFNGLSALMSKHLEVWDINMHNVYHFVYLSIIATSISNN